MWESRGDDKRNKGRSPDGIRRRCWVSEKKSELKEHVISRLPCAVRSNMFFNVNLYVNAAAIPTTSLQDSDEERG